jgi:tetratricopeptide (TPR) repeat protein
LGLLMLAGAGIGLFMVALPNIGFGQKFAIGFLCLIPGRIGPFRGLHKSLREHKNGNHRAAIATAQQLLDTLSRNPWKKKLVLGWTGVYSNSLESLCLNNIGAAHAHLLEFEEAEASLTKSIAHDALNPLPYFNLAVLDYLRGNEQSSAAFAAHSIALGYSRSASDAVLQRIDEINAQLAV